MHMRQRKQLVALSAAAVAVVAVAVLLVGLTRPVRVQAAPTQRPTPAPRTAQNGQPPVATDVAEVKRPTLAELQRVSAFDLRRPLYDPPKAASSDEPDHEEVSAQRARQSMQVRLMGTTHEPGHSMALFRKMNSRQEWCKIGESVEDPGGPVKVTAIDMEKVTVEFRGQTFELDVPVWREGQQ